MATKLIEYHPEREQRIAAITHVVYEYANLLCACRWSMHGLAPWRTNVDDAFLLGYRKLADFLMNNERSRMWGQELDDVLALDYLPEGRVRDWVLPTWVSEWRDPMKKQLAHIAYKRDKQWDHVQWLPTLEAEIRGAWSRFRAAVVDNQFNQEFERQLAICRAKTGFGDLNF